MTTPAPHDWPQLTAALVRALCLDRAPVGIKVFASAEEYAAWPAPEPDVATSYCGYVKAAAGREGVGGEGCKIHADHLGCATAAHLLGVSAWSGEEAFVESYATEGLYRDEEVARRALANVPSLADSFGFAIQPLSAFRDGYTPDVVIVVAPAHSAMRLVQGYSYHDAEGALSQTFGMHGICAESTAAPLTTGRVCVSLLCSGARHEAQWGEGDVSVSMPADRFATAVDGVLQTLNTCESDERKQAIIARGDLGAGVPQPEVRLGTGYFCERAG